MDNIKEFKIIINGLAEAVDQANALNEALNALDRKINSLESKSINIKVNQDQVNTTSTYVRGQRVGDLQTEDKLLRDIQKTEEQIANTRRDAYQDLLAQKDILKEVTQEAKERAAAERLMLGNYGNTMKGLKEELSDIKTVMQTTDLGSDKFTELTTRAGDLTQKLKDIEQSYGQFGRSVGNYASGVADGLNKYTVQVGNMTREFNSARDAVRTLTNELLKLPKGAQGAEELHAALLKVRSDIADLQKSSAVMDGLLDTMQSFVAIASMTNGIQTLFGFDNEEIQKSIQKLIALQNVLRGIETINKQMKSREGVGAWIAPFNTGIDTATKKLLVYNRALLGTGTAAKAASVGINLMGKALKTAFSVGIILVINLAIEAVSELIEKIKEANKAAKDEAEVQKEVNKAYANGTATITKYTQKVKNFNGTKKEEERLVKELNSELGKSLGTYNSLAKWMDVLTQKGAAYVKMLELEAKAQAAFNLYVQALQAEQVARNKSVEDSGAWYDDFLDFLDPSSMVRRRNKARVQAIQDATAYTESVKEGMTQAQKDLEDFMKSQGIGDYSPQIENNNDKNTKVTVDAIKELNMLRIANMKEGLNKVLAQLEEERRQKIAKIRTDGVMVKELELETNKYYDKRIEDEKRKHAEEEIRIYGEMWEKIYQMSLENSKRLSEIAGNEVENERNKFENSADNYLKQGIGSYGIQGKNTYSPSTQEKLGIVSTIINSDIINDYKKYIEILRDYEIAQNKFKTLEINVQEEIARAEQEYQDKKKKLEEELNDIEAQRTAFDKEEFEKRKAEIEKEIKKEEEKTDKLAKLKLKEKDDAEKHYKELEKQRNDYIDFLESTYSEEERKETFKELLDEQYSKSLSQTFKQRMSAVDAYWTARIHNEKIYAEALYQQNVKLENEEFQERLRNVKKQAEAIQDEADAALEAGKITEETWGDIVEEAWVKHTDAVILIEKEHSQKLIQLEQEKKDKIKQINGEYYQDALQELRDFQTAINNLEQKQPVMNAFGIINVKQTKKNNKELKDAFDALIAEIKEKRKKLVEEFNEPESLIDKNVFESSIRELDRFAAELGDKIDAIHLNFGDIWQGVDTWLQQIGQSVSSILSSLSEISSNYYEGEISKQEEYISKYQDLLDKQKEATEKYADEVDAIEDELANARGARRQALIDQLNAQMAAQRASLEEEKKLEKEKAKAEEKKRTLENEQAKKKKRMDEAQALINAAMAISMAAVNKWPIPAIPMIAMATAVGAAQYAAIKSQNIPTYGEGGRISGKSHSQGGVKALVSGSYPVELEGQEYIIRKSTATKNVELLEYVNNSQRKLKLEDFIDFYSSGKLKKTITASSPKAKYADGGQIPMLRSDITLNDRMLQAFEDYSNRPQYVEVVEILDKADSVRNVQVLAGMEPTSI